MEAKDVKLKEVSRGAICSPTSAYEWQAVFTTRLAPWPAAAVNVATVGKERGREVYLVLPALRFAETIGFNPQFESLRAVRKHLRESVARSLTPVALSKPSLN